MATKCRLTQGLGLFFNQFIAAIRGLKQTENYSAGKRKKSSPSHAHKGWNGKKGMLFNSNPGRIENSGVFSHSNPCQIENSSVFSNSAPRRIENSGILSSSTTCWINTSHIFSHTTSHSIEKPASLPAPGPAGSARHPCLSLAGTTLHGHSP